MKRPSIESQLFEALAFAAHKHRQQRRKDVEASPYINHPIALARTLAVEGGVVDTKTLIAAVLHDTVEDTETSSEEIGALSAPSVADMVREVTDDKTARQADRKRLQIEHAPHRTPRAPRSSSSPTRPPTCATSPPARRAAGRSTRRRAYFDWAKAVVDRLPPVSKRLRAAFDEAYSKRP